MTKDRICLVFVRRRGVSTSNEFPMIEEFEYFKIIELSNFSIVLHIMIIMILSGSRVPRCDVKPLIVV